MQIQVCRIIIKCKVCVSRFPYIGSSKVPFREHLDKYIVNRPANGYETYYSNFLKKNIYEYLITSLHKNVILVFSAEETTQTRGFFPS